MVEISVINNLRNKEISLRRSLYDPFEKSFKGSKAQRKNAEKELKKLQKEISELVNQRRQEILDEIASIERQLSENLRGCWWEVYGIDYDTNLRQRLSDLKRSL